MAYEERSMRNDKSRDSAEHHSEPWTYDEENFLRTQWKTRSEEDLAIIAELLGRTIEACRQRYYEVQRRGTRRTTRATVTVRVDLPGGSLTTRETKEVSDYIGALDEPEDRWWE